MTFDAVAILRGTPPVPLSKSQNHSQEEKMAVSISTGLLIVLIAALFVCNVYQFLVQRSALRIADILYIYEPKLASSSRRSPPPSEGC